MREKAHKDAYQTNNIDASLHFAQNSCKSNINGLFHLKVNLFQLQSRVFYEQRERSGMASLVSLVLQNLLHEAFDPYCMLRKGAEMGSEITNTTAPHDHHKIGHGTGWWWLPHLPWYQQMADWEFDNPKNKHTQDTHMIPPVKRCTRCGHVKD